MTETNDRESFQSTSPQQPGAGGGHRGLVFGAAILATTAAIVAGVYGIRTGSLAVKALALEGALVALAAWLCLHAFRIRRRILEAQEWEPEDWEQAEAQEEEGEEDVALHDAFQARKVHYAVLAKPATLLLGSLAVFLLGAAGGVSALVPKADWAAVSVICLVACCLWLVLSKSFEAVDRDDLPEGPALMLAFRDLQWVSLLVAGGILGSMLWPESADGEAWSPPEIWVARIIAVWILAVSLEQLIRIAVAWLRHAPLEDGFVSPTYLLLREAVFVRGNPIASIFETIESRFGVSFRSSWAIRFVRAAALPSLLAVVLLFWGLTCLAVVGTNELGVRESFGRIQGGLLPPAIESTLPRQVGTNNGGLLGPGLHLKLPWPFGRVHHYPVKEIRTKTIGSAGHAARQRSFLWGKAHAEDEFALVLGSETEVVAVDAMLYYKIHEDRKRFLDYVYTWESPEEAENALEAYAYRALMELTRSARLEEVLSTDRAKFADRLEESVRNYAETNRLGIDVIDLALVSFHPPVEVAAEYLDVVSAAIDANRFKIEADGYREAQLWEADRRSASRVAAAEIGAAREVGKAIEQSAGFLAIQEAYAAAPDALALRLWYETIEEALGVDPLADLRDAPGQEKEASEGASRNKRLIVLDETLAADRGDVIIDMRPQGETRPKGKNQELVPGGVR